MGQVICVSSFESQKKQTLFATYLSLLLADKTKTALLSIPNDELEMFLARRHQFNLKNHQNLPVPAHFVYEKKCLENKADFSFIVLNVKNFEILKDTDILITFVDTKETADALADSKSKLSSLLWNAKKSRAANGKNAFKHFVVPSLILDKEAINSLKKAANLSGFSLTNPFDLGKVYEDGLKGGITFLDKNLPKLEHDFSENDFFARRHFKELMTFIFS